MSEQTQIPREKMLTRLGQLKSERASWYPHWKEISTFLLPRNGRFFIQDRNKGWRRHNEILDSTGTRALRTLAAGLMSGATSPARPWFRLTTADPDLAQHYAVKVWMSEVTRIMLAIFAKSNTYRTFHSMYEELGAFGTAASIIDADFRNVIHHYPSTVGEFSIATDWQGNPNTLYREFQKTVGEVVKEFGKENVTPSTRALFDRGSLDTWISIIHAIEPREDRDTSKRNAKNMPFRSCYFEIGADPGKYLRESGYKRFPVLAPRWAVGGGDIYGNSPGMEALGDLKQLQHEQLRKGQVIDYQTKPPLQVPSSMKNRDVETLPGGITFVDNMGQGGVIKSAFDVNLNLQHLLEDIQDVRERINDTFFVKLFLMLATEDQRMTATEVAARNEEKMVVLGPVIERLQNEMQAQIIDITFDRMVEAKIIPPPPQDLQGQELQVEFVSMLAQAQRAIQTNGVDRFVVSLGSLAQMKPDVLDKFDSDTWADRYSDMLGVDPEMIVPNDKVAIIRAQRQQQQRQQQQAALANQQADTIQKLGNAPTTGGNALSNAVSNYSGYT